MKKNIILFTVLLILIGSITIYSCGEIDGKIIDLLQFNSKSTLV